MSADPNDSFSDDDVFTFETRRMDVLNSYASSSKETTVNYSSNDFCGFSTASNKPIVVDADSLKRAREKFCFEDVMEDVENGNLKKPKLSEEESKPSVSSILSPSIVTIQRSSFCDMSPKPRSKGFMSPFTSPLTNTPPPRCTPNPGMLRNSRFITPLRQNSPLVTPTTPVSTVVNKPKAVVTDKGTDSSEEYPSSCNSREEQVPFVNLCDLAKHARTKIEVSGVISRLLRKSGSSSFSFTLSEDTVTVDCQFFSKDVNKHGMYKEGMKIRVWKAFVKYIAGVASLVLNDRCEITILSEPPPVVPTKISEEDVDIELEDCVRIASVSSTKSPSFKVVGRLHKGKVADTTYNGCSVCKKRLDSGTTCSSCDSGKSKDIFQLNITIYDFTGSSSVVFYDEIACQLLGINITQALEFIKYDSDDLIERIRNVEIKRAVECSIKSQNNQLVVDKFRFLSADCYQRFIEKAAKARGVSLT